MPPLNMLIKPASGSCNLRCAYCFYYDEMENREQASYGRMTPETQELLVRRAFEYAEGSVMFSFQGGEPTLMGLPFYRRLLELQLRYNTRHIVVQNTIQTNGTLINGEWAAFLAENNFLVGLSLDGPREVQNKMRTDAKGKGTFDRVMQTVSLFEQYGVEYNILMVVNHYVARNIEKVYRFFKQHKIRFLQPSPCLDPIGVTPGSLPYSLTVEDYTYFLKTLFDLWYADFVKGDLMIIRTFDNYIGILMGYSPEICSMLGNCICQFVTEANGDVYPCDFYVLDEWRMGNIRESSFAELREGAVAKRFLSSSYKLPAECFGCEWFNLCKGGCRRNREPFAGDVPSDNQFCGAYKAFFAHAAPRMKQIAAFLVHKAAR
ncbi:MAG: anaerobic sulfatase maturase [Clostridia bacterium]|nr:anaerobic sulfatase maturase [Clostridia bacterium]